jgi:hypothetical protein
MEERIKYLLEKANVIAAEYDISVDVVFSVSKDGALMNKLVGYGQGTYYSLLMGRVGDYTYQDNIELFINSVVNKPEDFREILSRSKVSPIWKFKKVDIPEEW